METIQLIDLLQHEIEDSKNALFSSDKKVDADHLLDIIHEIRMTFPEELRQAELIRQEKQAIISDARTQADLILEDAQRRAKEQLENHEITRQAIDHGNEIVANAQKNAKDIRMGARGYAEDMLDDIEGYLEGFIESVARNRESLSGRRGEE